MPISFRPERESQFCIGAGAGGKSLDTGPAQRGSINGHFPEIPCTADSTLEIDGVT